jgi:hypothetical protein
VSLLSVQPDEAVLLLSAQSQVLRMPMDYVRAAIDWFVSLNSLFIIAVLVIGGLAAIGRLGWSWMKRPFRR